MNMCYSNQILAIGSEIRVQTGFFHSYVTLVTLLIIVTPAYKERLT